MADGVDALIAQVSRAIATMAIDGATWRTETSGDRRWIHVCNDHAVPRDQGWKLHVSASLFSADAVLKHVLPVLLSEAADFKIASSAENLAALNEGLGGLGQVGKYITVYPNDDTQAVRLAAALDAATLGLRGPAVPSSRPLRYGSLVHYRYGTFNGYQMQTQLGETVPALTAPDGALVPDPRGTRYLPPQWTDDPFVASGLARDLPEPSLMIGGRFLVVGTLSEAACGSTSIAVDMESPRVCVVKRAKRDAVMTRDGQDARDRLRHEAAVLSRLAASVPVPSVFALVEHDDDLYLAMEDVGGETLTGYVRGLARHGCTVSDEELVALGRKLTQTLATVHAAGLAYGDLKSSNVLVTRDGEVRLVDFESACDLTGTVQRFQGSTRGYESPQRRDGAAPAIADDIYALGALLYFLATGIEPSLAPRPFALLDRPLEVANPDLSPGIARVIERCLDEDLSRRFSSMTEVDAELARAATGQGRGTIRPRTELTDDRIHEARARYRELARQLGDTLCTAAEGRAEGGVAWMSNHPASQGAYARDINTGCAGTVLALSELVAEIGCTHHRHTLEEAAWWLGRGPARRSHPGLYIGESGVGAALLRAGQVLGEERLIEAAAERGRHVAALPHTSPDLFNGTAGRARFHLLLWDETNDDEHLDAALRAGTHLLQSAEDCERGGKRWTIPPGYAGLSGSAYVGYAHGAAGIGDALLDLFDATQEERFLAAAQGAGQWLARLATPVLGDETGLDWPRIEGGLPSGAFWCHGATGVGRFFAHAAQVDVLSGALEFASRAAKSVALGTRWAGPTQCHGLAGNIELLLDMARITREHGYLADAHALARLLEAFASTHEGSLTWPAESPQVFTPDYMVGYAGVAICMLRLSAPDRLPMQLSRAGFRRQRVGEEVSCRA